MDTADERQFKVLRCEGTPNPGALKFVLNQRVIASGTRAIDSEEDAEGDPMAEALFSFGGVENVYINGNFVSVTLLEPEDWELFADPIKKTIEEHVRVYEASPHEEDPEPADFSDVDYPSLSDDMKAEIVDAFLETTVRPALAQDGGGVEVVDVEGDLVRIRYQGACGSCPSSLSGTLRTIQNMLQEKLSGDIQVRSLSGF